MELFINSTTPAADPNLRSPSVNQVANQVENLKKSKSDLSHDANLKALGVTHAEERCLDPILFLVGMAG